MPKGNPEYLRRNLDVANCYGLNAGLCSIQERMRRRKDCPAWLLLKLGDMIYRSNCLLQPLIDHRNELPPFLEEEIS
jgi:hypothetical protein